MSMYLKEVIQKTKKGGSRKYLQFVESVRTDKGPRQNILVNIGRVDDKSGQERVKLLTDALLELSNTIHILDVERDVQAKSSKHLGMGLVFRRLFDCIGIDDVFAKVFSDVKTDFDVKSSIFNLVLNRLENPCAKSAMEDWQEDQYGIKGFDTHQYYRAMDHLHDHQKEIEKQIYTEMKKQSESRSADVSVALFDTTSVVYYGRGDADDDPEEDEQPLLDYGFSKARRSDLKQIVVGVAMTKDGIPLSHKTYSGNTNDVSCFSQIIDKFSECHGAKRVTFVGDRGLISHKNIEHLVSSGYQYILGFKMRTISKQDRAGLLQKADLRKLKKNLEFRDIEYKGKRLVIYYNEERALKDKQKRDEILARIKEKIKGGTIKSIVSSKDYKKFLKIEGEKPTLDQNKIDADAVFDGIFILSTNTATKPGELVSTYRDLWQCEAGFRTLKSELDLQPLYHRKRRRIETHVFICFIALICKNVLTKKLRKLDKEASYKKTIVDLKRLQAVDFDIHKTSITARTEIKQRAKTAFRALNMGFPKKVLAHSNNEKIVIQA